MPNFDVFQPNRAHRWHWDLRHLYQQGKLNPGSTSISNTMYNQGGLALGSIAFDFESLGHSTLPHPNPVEFGQLFVTWNVRMRGQKIFSVARPLPAPPIE